MNDFVFLGCASKHLDSYPLSKAENKSCGYWKSVKSIRNAWGIRGISAENKGPAFQSSPCLWFFPRDCQVKSFDSTSRFGKCFCHIWRFLSNVFWHPASTWSHLPGVTSLIHLSHQEIPVQQVVRHLVEVNRLIGLPVFRVASRSHFVAVAFPKDGATTPSKLPGIFRGARREFWPWRVRPS